jgi:hypothetical protein
MLIAVLVAVLYPRFYAMTYSTRLAGVQQDALSIGAAIESLKVEGLYNPEDAGLRGLINEKTGKEYEGRVSGLNADGCFIYTHAFGGAVYVVRYDSLTGGVYEVVSRNDDTQVD